MHVADVTSLPFVLSIRPTYVQRILAGQKTIELRRRFPNALDRVVLIYSTSPVQAIVATARLRAVQPLRLSQLWRIYGHDAAVTKAEFDAYFTGADEGCALILDDVMPFRNPMHLTDLVEKFEFSPPQSYCYWKASLRELTTHGRVKATARH